MGKKVSFDIVVSLLVSGILASYNPISTNTPIPALRVPESYPRIQATIDAAQDGDVIVVSLGTYNESIDFNGRNITLRSSDPDDPEVVATTVINSGGTGSVVTFQRGETGAAMLEGITIINGGSTTGGGITVKNSSPTIENNVISNNHAEELGGGFQAAFVEIIHRHLVNPDFLQFKALAFPY